MDELKRAARIAMALLWIFAGLGAVHAVKVVIEPLPKDVGKSDFSLVSFNFLSLFRDVYYEVAHPHREDKQPTFVRRH
ncbi:unnamed protein product [Arctia plantaginis]|uniref:Uncharacterized protein n=1 Tax=Arctia plantaginis TaxID=874455 RepID=A0A8S1AHY3_ARCPL|nr:unnamed protein product [Arctia plantaginis]